MDISRSHVPGAGSPCVLFVEHARPTVSNVTQNVIDVARACGLEVAVERVEDASASAAAAAQAIGCEQRQIGRSALFVADGEPVLCVLSGTDEVDPARLCDALDCAEVRPASADEARAATGFPLGAVPPLGHDVEVLIDARLMDDERIYTTGGDGRTLVALDPRALAAAVGAQIVALTS